ncbi:MAG: outer membrane lipoprotein-sorting protein [Nitrospirae bacterium]|nr:outer membrane lipoprotein-sorting protein [Nitrospirota bacterium]
MRKDLSIKKVTEIFVLVFFLSFSFASFAGIPYAAAEMSGKEIMEKQKKLQQTNDEKEILAMKLIDKKGNVKDRKIVRYSMKAGSGLNKIMMVFLEPKDVKGTGLLTWEQKGGDDDQWLYLPELGKEKRIASGGKKNKFMGTDFAFEDLRPENLAAHQYNSIGSEQIEGKDCLVIEALPAGKEEKESGYSKRKLWIRKDIFFTVKIEYYDKKGKLIKVQENKNAKNVAGTVWRSDEIVMKNLGEEHQTSLIVQSRNVNKGLDEDFFSLRKLKSPE